MKRIMPRVSVVVPCYNQAHFLGEAIESIHGASDDPIEIVVVDDGSTDMTAGVASRFPEIVYVCQSNQGLAAARNTGLRHSRGEFLVFLDADDLLLPGAVRAGLDLLDNRPECAFVSGHFRYVRADGAFLNQYPQPAIGDDPYAAMLRGNYIAMHATVMYRRSILQAIGGFDPNRRACEDYDLYLKITRRHPVARHGQVVASYRQHGSNMSGDTQMMLRTVLSVLETQRPYVMSDPRLELALAEGIRSWKRHYGRQLVKQLSAQRLWFRSPELTLRGLHAAVRYGPGWMAERVK